LVQQVRQLGDVDRDAPRLVMGHQLCRGARGESCAAFPRACGAVGVTEQSPGDLRQTDLASPASALITGPPITQTVMAA